MIEFVDVELSEELAERFRLLCQAAGDEPRDEIIAAAIDRYFRSGEGDVTPSVIPMRLVHEELR